MSMPSNWMNFWMILGMVMHVTIIIQLLIVTAMLLRFSKEFVRIHAWIKTHETNVSRKFSVLQKLTKKVFDQGEETLLTKEEGDA